MSKLFAVIAAGMLMLATCGLADATPPCPPGSHWGPAGCVPDSTGGGDIDVDVSNHNFNTNMNHNSNMNINSNHNVNMNKNVNHNTAVQGQIQGQGQKQQMIDNSVYEDKRDHITGPNMLSPTPGFRDGAAFELKMYGFDLLNAKDMFSWEEALKLSADAKDFMVIKGLTFENGFRTSAVRRLVGESNGVLMGYIHVIPKGPKCTGASAIGMLMEAAMKAGATHYAVVATDALEEGEGGAYNIGLSGGASLLSSGDKIATAPNGGLGYGKAWTHNELRPGIVAKIFFDKDMVVMPTKDDFQNYEDDFVTFRNNL